MLSFANSSASHAQCCFACAYNGFALRWEVARYIADDPNPNLEFAVPRNQGREAMPYLTCEYLLKMTS